MGEVLGIHHMTAISGPAQENLGFYTEILGLRLVKLTVNFDDPSAHHLYYGDVAGSPGTILTFFPYPDGHEGRVGGGQASLTSLSIPPNSVDFWQERLEHYEVEFQAPSVIEGTEQIHLKGPDGLPLALIATKKYQHSKPWLLSTVPSENAIGGIDSITLIERSLAPTRAVLENILGFKLVGETSEGYRFEDGLGGHGHSILVQVDPQAAPGRQGPGAVHHIAFRVANAEAQLERRLELVKLGYHVSAVMNRNYFQSIYFREPGGVLFEIATDEPGFTADEPLESLGTHLKLPEQYEPFRAQIEEELPDLHLQTMEP